MSKFYSKSAAVTVQPSFDDMLKNFGVVTVMNAKVFNRPLYGDAEGDTTIIQAKDLKQLKAHDILKALLEEAEKSTSENPTYTQIDTLKIANINMEGPTKTVTGGQYTNPLIKFGKTATIEMQDALGRADVIEALGGGIVEIFPSTSNSDDIIDGYTKVLHLTQDFAGAKTILGESFFIDQKTGGQVLVYILLYEMLPDSIFNLTQDAEGDATVFDLNGSLSAVDIMISDDKSKAILGGTTKGVFYSVLPQRTLYNHNVVKTYKIIANKASGADDIAGDIAEAFGTNGTYVSQSDSAVTLPVRTGYTWYTKIEPSAEDSITSIAPTEEGVSVYVRTTIV